ncbi:MAG: MarR family winged helix-turn-helix transcriptional regulator [Beijerinckiaceae bacterium]
MDRAHPLFPVFNEIGIIAQLSQKLFESVMPDGMTLAQFTVLNHFVRLGGEKSPAALADAFQVTRATMTSTLQRLEAKGFVAVRPDPEDGRGKIVTLTDEGREMRRLCVERLGPAFARLEGKHDLADIDALMPHLVRLRRLLDEDRAALPSNPA